MRLLLLLLLIPVLSKGQSSVDTLINSLSWKSFSIKHATHVDMIVFEDDASKRLIACGKKVSKKSFEGLLEDSSRVVIAHLILTQIWQPKKFVLYSTPDYEGALGVTYSLYGLKWRWEESKGFYVVADQWKTLRGYWTKK